MVSASVAYAASPMYIVNGEPRESIDNIPHEQIASFQELEVDESLIAKYGLDASKGVIFVELKYDVPAQLSTGESLYRLLVNGVKWSVDEGVQSVSFRYKVSASGEFILGEFLNSTSARFKRRVISQLSKMPQWRPAQKRGEGVEWDGVVTLTLPEGMSVPIQKHLIYR
ncbi:MAG: TonB-dependent receptor [Rikenellaceae bacterium]